MLPLRTPEIAIGSQLEKETVTSQRITDAESAVRYRRVCPTCSWSRHWLSFFRRLAKSLLRSP